MSKIFSPPSEVTLPKLDFNNIPQYKKDCEKFENDLREWLKQSGYAGDEVGEVLYFNVADGKAAYMVASIKPLELIHLPLWDGYSFPYIENLTVKDVREKIKNQKAIKKLFNK